MASFEGKVPAKTKKASDRTASIAFLRVQAGRRKSGADPDAATADQAVAGDRGSRAGSALRPETSAREAWRV